MESSSFFISSPYSSNTLILWPTIPAKQCPNIPYMPGIPVAPSLDSIKPSGNPNTNYLITNYIPIAYRSAWWWIHWRTACISL